MSNPTSTTEVPEPLAQRIRAQFESLAQRQASEHRRAGAHRYSDAYDNRNIKWVKAETDPTLQRDLLAAGVEMAPGWTYPSLIGIGCSVNDRVDEILAADDPETWSAPAAEVRTELPKLNAAEMAFDAMTVILARLGVTWDDVDRVRAQRGDGADQP